MSASICQNPKALQNCYPPNFQLLQEKEHDSDFPLHMQNIPWVRKRENHVAH